MEVSVPAEHFCVRANAMIMYADGFRMTLWRSSSAANTPCLNYLSSSFPLDTRPRFVLAMAVTVLLGLTLERLSLAREQKNARDGSPVAIACIHGAHAVVGYVLMVVAMSFSIELLACCVLSLWLGPVLLSEDSTVFRESGAHMCHTAAPTPTPDDGANDARTEETSDATARDGDSSTVRDPILAPLLSSSDVSTMEHSVDHVAAASSPSLKRRIV